MAAAVLRAKLAPHAPTFRVNSAGAAAWHAGDPADPMAVEALARRGYPEPRHGARRVEITDFHNVDLMLAMDLSNLAALDRIAPPGSRALRCLFHPDHEIHDPYYDGASAFDAALALIEAAADLWLAEWLPETAATVPGAGAAAAAGPSQRVGT